MRLTTIWTIQAMDLSERLRRTRDWAAMTAAARMPKRVRYWGTMLEIGKAVSTSPDVPATPLDEVLKNMAHPDDKVKR